MTAKQVLDQRIATERYEIEHEPEEERAELAAIYRNKGFSGPLLDCVMGASDGKPGPLAPGDVHDELGVVEDTHINPWLERGVDRGLLRPWWPHPAGAVAVRSATSQMVGVWLHSAHCLDLGSDQSSLHPAASCAASLL
jgi:hypothetical protein